MRIAGLIQDSVVDGPGLRFVVFTQGCDIGCKGCHNSEAINITGGTEMHVSEIISEMLSNPLTDGLTLSGGEPFMQGADCSQLAKAAREHGLNVWIFTGNIFEELVERAKREKGIKALLEYADVIVDGPFEVERRSLSLKWRGSKNQRVIDVQKSIAMGNTVELKISALTV